MYPFLSGSMVGVHCSGRSRDTDGIDTVGIDTEGSESETGVIVGRPKETGLMVGRSRTNDESSRGLIVLLTIE